MGDPMTASRHVNSKNGGTDQEIWPWNVTYMFRGRERFGPWASRGDRARDAGNWEEAVKCYGEALRINNRLPSIWVQYGNAKKSLWITSGKKDKQELDEVMQAYCEAFVLLHQEAADVVAQIGHVWKHLDDEKLAQDAYLTSFIMNPIQNAEDELLRLGLSSAAIQEASRLRNDLMGHDRFLDTNGTYRTLGSLWLTWADRLTANALMTERGVGAEQPLGPKRVISSPSEENVMRKEPRPSDQAGRNGKVYPLWMFMAVVVGCLALFCGSIWALWHPLSGISTALAGSLLIIAGGERAKHDFEKLSRSKTGGKNHAHSWGAE
jgi:tetratricopeptide (TPR) repeat protein